MVLIVEIVLIVSGNTAPFHAMRYALIARTPQLATRTPSPTYPFSLIQTTRSWPL